MSDPFRIVDRDRVTHECPGVVRLDPLTQGFPARDAPSEDGVRPVTWPAAAERSVRARAGP